MYDKIRRNNSYKTTLKVIAKLSEQENNWVARKTVINHPDSVGKNSVDPAFSKLVEKNLLVKNPSKQGEYRVYSNMFRVYVTKMLH